MILWHATDYQNIPNIMAKGIIPNRYNEVFFADNCASAMMFLAMRGHTHIVALPVEFKPAEVKESFDHSQEFYRYVGWLEACGKWTICADRTQYLTSYDNDNLRVDTGNCFRTREEAEAAKYEVFKRLTGKDWNETYGKEGGNNATN